MSVTPYPENRAAVHGEPSAPEAAERAVEAARGLLEDRLRLVKVQATSALRNGTAVAALLATGAVFLLFAWAAASVALALALQRFLAPDASVACVALLNLSIGGALLLLGRRRGAAGESS
jgi:hypothetical protein